MKYFLSIGSNINAKNNINLAFNELHLIFTNFVSSSIHETVPEGFEGDNFLNLVTSGETNLTFEELHKILKKIEDKSGRDRSAPKFSARTLDIDIVLQMHNDKVIFESDDIQKYKFVSDPLKEIL